MAKMSATRFSRDSAAVHYWARVETGVELRATVITAGGKKVVSNKRA